MVSLSTLRRNIANFIQPNSLNNKFNQAFLWGLGGGGYTLYDPKGTTYIDEGYNINPIVYSIINQQATKTASIPYYIKKIEDEIALKSLIRLRQATKMNMNAQQKVQHLLLESKAFQNNEMAFPMERPNANQNWTEFIALYKTFLKLTGNVYIYMLTVEDGANAGKPMALYILPSQDVQIIVKDHADYLGIESPIKSYILTQGRAYIEFEAENVIHIKYPNPNYGENGEHLYGQSPLRSALKNIMSSNSALDLNIRTLKSGGAFGFLHGKQTAITPDQAKELKERLTEMNNDPANLGKIAGVSADMGFTRISLTSDELKPFDFLNFDQKMIANVLGWSDKLLNNDQGAKYDNIGEERKRMITDNIVPDLNLLEDALNNYFLPRFKGYEGSRIEFDVMELPEMQEDAVALSGWLYDGLDKAVFNRNEVRKALRWVELENPDMERFTVQNDIITLEEAIDNEFNITEDPNPDPDLKKKSLKAGFDPDQPRGRGGLWTSGNNVQKTLEGKYKDLTIDIYQDDDGKVLTLSRVVVPHEMRNKGIGTKFMNDLIGMADEMKYKIILTPSGDFGGDPKRLKEFYKRFGFVLNKGSNRDFSHKEDMYRIPK